MLSIVHPQAREVALCHGIHVGWFENRQSAITKPQTYRHSKVMDVDLIDDINKDPYNVVVLVTRKREDDTRVHRLIRQNRVLLHPACASPTMRHDPLHIIKCKRLLSRRD
jgi:hypothetical protein